MPTYTIKAPDGNTYSVQGPPNAPQEDVQAEVLRQHPDSGNAPQANATDGMSTTDKVLAGVGKAYVDTGRGAQQAANEFGDKARSASLAAEGISDDTKPTLSSLITGQKGTTTARDLSIQEGIVESRKYDKALESTNAGKAGELIGHMVIGLATPGGIVGQAAGGAVQGGLTPTAGNESRAQNAALGGGMGAIGTVAGRLLGKVVGGVLQPFRTEFSQAAQEGVETLNASGVPLNAAQQGGGRLARSFSSIAEDNPLNGSNLGTQQKKAFTGAVLRILGTNSEDARPSVMEAIRSKIGTTLDGLATKNPIALDEPLLQRMATIQASAEATMTKESYTPIEKQLDNILSYAAAGGGTINGQLFGNLRSELSLMQKGNSGIVGHWAGEVQDAVSEALERQAPADAQAINHARQAWRIMRQVEPGIEENNYINPAKLWNSMDAMSNINQMVRGNGDQTLVKIAQAGKLILGNQQPNSGTAARAAAMLTFGSILGGIDALVEGKPNRALEGAMIGLVGVPALKAASENPASARIIGRWARSKALAQFRENSTAFLGKVGGAAGAAAVPSMDEGDLNGTQ